MKNNAFGWLRFAQSDFLTAVQALKVPEILHSVACFHAQQCAEKAIKAVIISFNKQPDRTHNLGMLLNQLAELVDIEKEMDEVDRLTDYAVQTRYPGDWQEISYKEAENAIKLAESVLTWSKEIIGDKNR